MDEITAFRELAPAGPDEARVAQMGVTARARLAAAADGGRRPVRWRVPVAVGALAATAASIAVLTSGGTPARHSETVVTAAWTVKENTDGTVTIRLSELVDPARLQRTLRADGINAVVRIVPFKFATYHGQRLDYPACLYRPANKAPESVQHAVVSVDFGRPDWIIHPGAMPAGSALFISGGPAKMYGKVDVIMGSLPVVLTSSKVPACVPYKPPAPPVG